MKPNASRLNVMATLLAFFGSFVFIAILVDTSDQSRGWVTAMLMRGSKAIVVYANHRYCNFANILRIYFL